MRTTSMAIVMLLTSVLAVVGLAVPASAVSSQMTPSRHASQVATAATAGAVVTADDDAKPKKKKVCRASWLSAYGCVQVLAEGLGWLSKFWGNDRKCVKRIWYVPVNPSTGQPTGPGAWKCTKTVSR